VFETLGYAGGYAVYQRERRRRGDFLSDDRRWLILAAAAMGALIGSRVLGLAEQVPQLGFSWRMLLEPGGKTIVGGLLGAWPALEIAKLTLGIRSRTGDLFAVPICVGVAIGRIGCFMAGLADDTYGKPTTLPWGVDFGDGIARHPTQLYELIFLVLLALGLRYAEGRPHAPGAIFRWFMAAYLTWRFGIDFLKPQPVVHGLNIIQSACLVGLAVMAAGAIPRGPEVG
jgi:prolipoprotein diacylglyceryltransferase